MNRLALLIAVSALATGCAVTPPAPPASVHQPMSVRPIAPPQFAPENGAIYQTGSARLNLFDDRRARFVGDTLTILIEERTAGSKKASSDATKTSSLAFSIPTIKGFPFKTLQEANVSASNSSKFAGQGDSAANNSLTGNLTVTVIEVLANGNLLVSGEKQISINQGTEFVRFSGVVNPANIAGGNTVSSTKVADARVEYKGNGYVDEAQTMGWLQRFFLTVLPF